MLTDIFRVDRSIVVFTHVRRGVTHRHTNLHLARDRQLTLHIVLVENPPLHQIPTLTPRNTRSPHAQAVHRQSRHVTTFVTSLTIAAGTHAQRNVIRDPVHRVQSSSPAHVVAGRQPRLSDATTYTRAILQRKSRFCATDLVRRYAHADDTNAGAHVVHWLHWR